MNSSIIADLVVTSFLAEHDPEDLPTVLPPIIDLTSSNSQKARVVPARVKPLPDDAYYRPEKKQKRSTKSKKSTTTMNGKRMKEHEEEKAESPSSVPVSMTESPPVGYFAQSSPALGCGPRSSQDSTAPAR